MKVCLFDIITIVKGPYHEILLHDSSYEKHINYHLSDVFKT